MQDAQEGRRVRDSGLNGGWADAEAHEAAEPGPATPAAAAQGSMHAVHQATVHHAHLLPARQLLDSISTAQFCSRRPPSAVVTLRAGWTVAAALAHLQRSGLLAAPLYADEEEGDMSEDEQPAYLGFLSTADIVAAVVDRCIELAGGTARLERHVESAGAWLAQVSVGSIPRSNDAEVIFKTDDSLLRVIQQSMLMPASKMWAHRVAVVDRAADGLRITHVISQFDLIQLLWRHREQLTGLMRWTLGDLGFQPKPVITVPASMSAVDCLATLSLGNCSAAGVVDSSRGGILVGNLSASDLHGLTLDTFDLLALPVHEFLAQRHTAEHSPRSPRAGYAARFGVKSPGSLPPVDLPLATCTLSTSLGTLLEQLVTNRFHRSWLVDSEGRPAGVISCSDILALVAG